MSDFTEDQLMELYGWIDTIPLSRRKRHLARDFSDGVLMAEVVSHFYPKLVDLYNYEQGLRVDTKIYNWKHLNEKVLKKLHYQLDTQTISDLANCRPGAIERVLWKFKELVTVDKERSKKGYFQDDDDEVIPAHIQEITNRESENDRKLLAEKIEECEEQAQYIDALEQKIAKLEELNRLKDAKIAKLMRQLERYVG